MTHPARGARPWATGTLVVLVVAWAGCREAAPRDDLLRVGAEDALHETETARALIDAFQASSKIPVDLSFGSAASLHERTAKKELDIILVAEAKLAPLDANGPRYRRTVVFAKDELAFVGQKHAVVRFRERRWAEPALVLEDIQRSGHLYLKARPGSVEAERSQALFLERPNIAPGSFVQSPFDGVALIKESETRRGIALIRRSSLGAASHPTPITGRVFASGGEKLGVVLRAHRIVSMEPRLSPADALMDFLASDRAREVIHEAAVARFGRPLYDLDVLPPVEEAQDGQGAPDEPDGPRDAPPQETMP